MHELHPHARHVLRTISLSVLGFLAVIAALLFMVYLSEPARYTILIIGSDQRGDERARSDVLMIVSIPKSPVQQMTILTIPRDTRVKIPEYGVQKMTHAYALGDREEGSDLLGNPALTQETVENFLGIEIDATAEFTFDSFTHIIDAFGGVDTSQGHLTGEEALAIVRDRFREGGDFARTVDQREIFINLVRSVNTPREMWELRTLFDDEEGARLRYRVGSTVQFGIAFVTRRLGHVSIGDVREEVVPGSGDSIYTPDFGKNLYYWIPDEEATSALVTELFGTPNK